VISFVASSHRSLRLLSGGILFACLAACFLGCREQDDVQSYTVERKLEEERIVKIREARIRILEETRGKADAPIADMPRGPMPGANVPAGKPEPGRLIGVLLPHGNEMWFFKVLGPDEAVKRNVEQVKSFITTVKFQGADPVWTVPAGWTEEPGDGISWASFVVEAGPPAIKLAASRFPGQQDLTANVNRWRNQVGLPNVDAAEAAKAPMPLETAAGPAMWVELSGTYTPKSGMGGPFSGGAVGGPMAGAVDPNAPLPAGHPSVGDMRNMVKGGAEFSNKRPSPLAPLPDAPFVYELPSGWSPAEPSNVNLAAFSVGEGSSTARITVSEAGGNLLDNINRWRVQELGLPEIDADQLLAGTTKLKVSGLDADFVELIAPAGAGPQQAILGVVAKRAAGPDGRVSSYFVKLKGSAPIAQSERERFLKFVTSLRFDR